MDEHQQLVDSLSEAYRRFWMALRQTAEPVWADLSLTISQLKCLVLLELRGSMAIGQVADLLAMSRSSASITIDQLVQQGLVSRTEDKEDRRRTIVCLTPQGYDLAARLHQGDEAFMRQWFERLTPVDMEALRNGLVAVADAIEATLA
jgi:DNA-binding MarR family transcriptional regulator